MTTAPTFCNCESAYCAHHGGQLVGPGGYPACDPCPNVPEGHYAMDWVGAICDQCAAVDMSSGAALSVYRLGVWGDPQAIQPPAILRTDYPGGVWPTLEAGRFYRVYGSRSAWPRKALLLAIAADGALLFALPPGSSRGSWRPWAASRSAVREVYATS